MKSPVSAAFEPSGFVVDSTLGKLAKYLRLAGFDTLQDTQIPDAGRLADMAGGQRIILTRSTKVKRSLADAVLIEHNEPLSQIRQVVAQLRLQPSHAHPLTRCAVCNLELEPLSKADAIAKVPEYVWRAHTRFKTCPQCRRVYWRGTHAHRWLERVGGIVDFPDRSTY
jgi:uncharacterized protein